MADPPAPDGEMPERRRSAAHVFVSPEELDAGGVLTLDSGTIHHLTRVLRLRDGEIVTVSDGLGRWRAAGVAGARDTFRVESAGDVIVEPRTQETMTLASAIPKGDRLDWMVQKATELGVDRIQLLHAHHSVVRWKPARFAHQLDRLRKISDEAARQSRRVRRVEILAPVDALGVLPTAVAAEPGGRPITSSDRVVAIGPEGGWSAGEIDAAADRVDLGPNILRTETAALAAIALSVVGRY